MVDDSSVDLNVFWYFEIFNLVHMIYHFNIVDYTNLEIVLKVVLFKNNVFMNHLICVVRFLIVYMIRHVILLIVTIIYDNDFSFLFFVELRSLFFLIFYKIFVNPPLYYSLFHVRE